MPYDKPDVELFSVLRDDVPEELIRKSLKDQRDVGLFMRYSLQHWDILQETHPNLYRYIAITSYQASPQNVLMREKIAASLLGVAFIMDETMRLRFAQRLEDARHLADTTHFETKKPKQPNGDLFDGDVDPLPST